MQRQTGAAVQRMARLMATQPRLRTLEDSFRGAVERHLPKDGKGVVFASAWLATDNIVVHLLHKHFPEVFSGFSLLAVDTLHLFPETHAVKAAVEAKYGKPARVFKPAGCETRADFEARYGHCEALNHADFDLHSKVEPYTRGLKELGKDVLITGRRSDQGEKRIALDLWEPQPRILNPMAEWLWPDITAFVDSEGVPVNPAHNYVFRSDSWIDPKQRHRDDLPWRKADLGKPFWRSTPEELAGSPPAAHAFVFKSFGDLHTSVPVYPHESERTGRFVRYSNTECGIHTRVAVPGAPYGGKLVDRMVKDEAAKAALLASCNASHELSERQSCDVELLVNGGFSPLSGFMTKEEYDHVVAHSRLPEQQLWGMPITLDTDDASVKVGDKVKLTWKGKPVAVVEVTSVWQPDKMVEAHHVFGTTSLEHPGVYDLAANRGKVYFGGPVHGLAVPEREMPCLSPAAVRATLPKGKPVVAFQCRNPIHKAHFELVRNVLRDQPDATVLIHPTVGPTQPGDIDAATRVSTYYALEKEVANPRIKWAFLPFNMRMAGPREAIQHMIVRKNFGCTHFIVGRDMAGTKSTRTQEDFYGPYDAQNVAKARGGEMAMTAVAYENTVYTKEKGYVSETEAKAAGLKAVKLSGTEFRRLLRSGEPIPEWFSFKSTLDILRKATEAGQQV